jgi:hypothetical protein
MAVAKNIPHATQDKMLDFIKSDGTELYLCSGANNVADRAAAIAASLIAVQTPSYAGPADSGSPVSSRALTVGALSGKAVTASGDATHIVICSGTAILAITTCTQQTLTSGNTVTIPAFIVTVNDVT